MNIIYQKFECERLRELASQWMQAATSDVMAERKKLWKALKNLKPERPMIRFETCSIIGYVADNELLCQNELLKNVERMMLLHIKHFNTIEDDIILEPYFQLAWKIEKSGFGVDTKRRDAVDSMGYVFNGGIDTPDDLSKLKQRTFYNDSENVLELKRVLDEIFGDIMHVKLGNVEILTGNEVGFNPLVGINSMGITFDIFQILGHEKMLLWAYDFPDALKELTHYLKDDRMRYYDFMEKQYLLDYNANGWNTSASSYGYCDDLPAEGQTPALTKDCWVWAESQETLTISPDMFAEFYLPSIAEVANRFGLAYYACCEPIHDRFHLIKKAIPKIRAVSISRWNDMFKAAQVVGRDYVFSRKPDPALISGPKPLWDAIKKDIKDTVKATKDMPCHCPLPVCASYTFTPLKLLYTANFFD